MPSHSLLAQLVLTYGLALALLLVAGRLRIPSIVALIVAGVIAGPGGAGIVSTEEDVEVLAEVGIVLLLFMVGLEFSVATLRRVWRTVVIGGTLQMSLTALGAAGLAMLWLGGPPRLAIFIGVFGALSSTAIVLKELTARNQADSYPGRLATGVLLFQDLAIIVLLALQPLATGEASMAVAARAVGSAVLAMIVAGGVGFVVLPRLLRIAASARSRDAFTIAVFLASIGTAWLTSLFGVSMALGAFLAGLVLGETEFSHQIHAELRPLRDALASLFFVSMGMLINPAFVLSSAAAVIGTAVLIVALKAVAATGALLLVATPLRVAAVGGLTLAQVGEFSFLLGRTAVHSNIVTPEVWQVLLAAGVLTMLVTPALVAYAPAAGQWVARVVGRALGTVERDPVSDLQGHVVIFGYGAGGRLLASALRDIGQPYAVVELNNATVSAERAKGETIHYGDASSPDALAAVNIAESVAVVCMISDPEASLRLVKSARSLSRDVPIIVRTRYGLEAERLRAAGATLAVAEEFEASLEVLAQLMARLHVPGNMIDVLLETFRKAGLTSRVRHAPSVPFTAMPEGIRQMPVATHRLEDRDWSVGRTLGEVNLRAQTGASVLAVKKGDEYVTSPSAALQLDAGDVLFLSGDESDVKLARARLSQGLT